MCILQCDHLKTHLRHTKQFQTYFPFICGDYIISISQLGKKYLTWKIENKLNTLMIMKHCRVGKRSLKDGDSRVLGRCYSFLRSCAEHSHLRAVSVVSHCRICTPIPCVHACACGSPLPVYAVECQPMRGLSELPISTNEGTSCCLR